MNDLILAAFTTLSLTAAFAPVADAAVFAGRDVTRTRSKWDNW
jgi:hypothetical protein